MLKGEEIKKGDSVALAYGLTPPIDLTGWDCKVMVKSALADVTPILELDLTTLTADKTTFTGLLSKDTTKNFPTGDLFLLAELSHAASGQAKEIHLMLRVAEQGVF